MIHNENTTSPLFGMITVVITAIVGMELVHTLMVSFLASLSYGLGQWLFGKVVKGVEKWIINRKRNEKAD
jgi:hypothetical protein